MFYIPEAVLRPCKGADTEDSMADFVDGDNGFISEESDFYGDEEMRRELENQACSFSPSIYLSKAGLNLTALSAQHAQIPSNMEPVQLRNPYEGNPCARQLSENVSDFLKRLPPDVTSIAEAGPWLWVANPYCASRSSNVASFKTAGSSILDALSAHRASLEGSIPAKSPDAISRQLKPFRKVAEQEIIRLAKENGVTAGKWLLFPLPEDVNYVWRVVAEGVVRGEMGIGAKVATDKGEGDRAARLICVYTEDFSDTVDVRKVLEVLVEKGLVKRNLGNGIWYKCDAYTHLDLMSGNSWGIKPTLYGSKEMLKMVQK